MKKILIVDDDNYKIENIKKLLLKVNSNFEVSVERALNPGLVTLLDNNFDFIVLDMSMPIFDLSETQNFDYFGGITFLKEMKRKCIDTPTAIVTQYEIFGEGTSRKTSESIDAMCKEIFHNYRGLIVYSSIDNNWMEKMVRVVGEVLND